jgi:hypothetical protein
MVAPDWSCVPELPVNYEALNRYVLAAIACFAVALYVAVLWVGWADIKLHLRKRASRGRQARRYPRTKRSN